MSSINQSIPVISLFFGCGGLDLGFEKEHFEPLLALDIDQAAVNTYNHNRTQKLARVADLSEVGGAEISRLLRSTNPGCSPRGVIGGPPCQAFSAGNAFYKSDGITPI
jgi:DNA (cytosine-5)-methyltransferase 1